MQPSRNSLIAQKPAFTFILFNCAAAIAGLVLYFSGTPPEMTVLVMVVTFAVINALLVYLRRMVLSTVRAQMGDEASAASPSKSATMSAWLLLLGGLFMLGSALFQISYPRLPSDRPLGFMMLIGSPAVLLMAWREYRK